MFLSKECGNTSFVDESNGGPCEGRVGQFWPVVEEVICHRSKTVCEAICGSV